MNKKEKTSFFQKMKKAIKEVTLIVGAVITLKDGIILAVNATSIAQKRIIDNATQDYLYLTALSEEEAIKIFARERLALILIVVLVLAFFIVMTKEFIDIMNRRKLELVEINKEFNLRKKYYRDLNDNYYYEYTIKNNNNKKDS